MKALNNPVRRHVRGVTMLMSGSRKRRQARMAGTPFKPTDPIALTDPRVRGEHDALTSDLDKGGGLPA